MNTFVLHLWDDESSLVNFYTVTFDGAVESETDKFFGKFRDDPQYREALQQLTVMLFEAIGEDHGAKDFFFGRFENEANALPPKSNRRTRELGLFFPGFPLRLYCYRVHEGLVILFNGGVKDAATAQESKDISLKFREACQFCKVIDKAFQERSIYLDGDEILGWDGSEEILLP